MQFIVCYSEEAEVLEQFRNKYKHKRFCNYCRKL